MVKDLADKWRVEAATLRAWAASSHAEVLERCAADLEARWREWELEALTLEEATAESGYSYSALQKKLASGELENVGSKGSPRVPRGQLPRKGGRSSAVPGLADSILLGRLG